MKREILSDLACSNLGKLVKGEFKIEAKRNASLALSYIAENGQRIKKEVISDCLTGLENKDIVIGNNTINFLCFYAKQDINFINSKQILENLVKKLNNKDLCLSTSLALREYAENIAKAEDKNTFISNIEVTAYNISQKDLYNTEVRRNLALSFAYASKNGCTLNHLIIENLIDFLPALDDLDTKRVILSTIGYYAERNSILFSEPHLSKVSFTLTDDHPDIRDSGRKVLENYLKNKHYNGLPKSFIDYLSVVSTNPVSALNASNILKEITENNNKCLSERNLQLISRGLQELDTQEIHENITKILAHSTANISDEALENLASGLNNENSEIIENTALAIKRYAANKKVLPENIFYSLNELLTNDLSNIRIKQHTAWAIAFAFGSTGTDQDILNSICESLNLEDSEVSNAALISLTQYFDKYYNHTLDNDSVCRKVEDIFNNQDLISNGVILLNKAIERELILQNESFSVMGDILTRYPDSKTRQIAKQILDHSKYIPEKVTKILEIENISQNLLDKSDLESLDRLKHLSEDGCELTRTSFEALETSFPNNNQKVIAILKSAIANYQQIPSSLIKVATYYTNFNKEESLSVKADVSRILRYAVETDQLLSSEVLESLGSMLKHGYFDYDASLALILIAKRNNSINEDIILSLDNTFNDYDQSTQSNILHSIKYAIPNLKNPSILKQLSNIDLSIDLTNLDKANHASTEKDLTQLIDELIEQNKDNKELLSLFQNQKLLNQITEITLVYESYSIITKNNKIIKDWNEKDIQVWSYDCKSNLAKNNLIENDQRISEIFAVVKRAVILDSTKKNKIHEPRTIQYLAVLIMLNQIENKGRLAQIATGEGKSTTISILAVFKVLQGYKVDVITSSNVLAKRDIKDKADFYRLFNITAMDNSDDTYNFNGQKKCYAKNVDIIYGEASSFQFDILREEYSGLGTRGNRSFEKTTAIVDEVDSMFIDDSSKIAMLAEVMPQMSHLNILFTSLWQGMNDICSKFEYLDHETLKYEDKLIPSNKFIDVLKQELQNYTDCLIESLTKEKSEITVPTHLYSFIKRQATKWVGSAIDAKFGYKKNHHYLIIKDHKGIERITPIDYSNTGIIQNSTTWSDGLQQFLQIKEGLRITAESLITNFLSNKAYFNRYSNRILGLTGTLGSVESRRLLSKVYSVDFVNIPRYKARPFIEKQAIITNSKKEWLEEVINTALSEVDKKRASLIICETKKQADKICNELQNIYRQTDRKGKIVPYTRDDNNENKAVESTLNAGDIIVATNLAGRGTDIKTSNEIEQNGGLHVCVTFLPNNLRVEEQAFGRTARQGQNGTAQLILNREKLGEQYIASYTIDKIREKRDALEKEKLDHFYNFELKQIDLKDKFFDQFCKLTQNLRNNAENFSEPEKLWHQSKMHAMEERWGLFLKHLGFTDPDDAALKFSEFLEEITKEYAESEDLNKIIQNPTYYIRYANSLIEHANSNWTKSKYHSLTAIEILASTNNIEDEYGKYKYIIYQRAINSYSKAISLDPNNCYIGYSQRAYAIIEIGVDVLT